MKKQVTAQRAGLSVNKHLLNIITPSGIEENNLGKYTAYPNIRRQMEYPMDGLPISAIWKEHRQW